MTHDASVDERLEPLSLQGFLIHSSNKDLVGAWGCRHRRRILLKHRHLTRERQGGVGKIQVSPSNRMILELSSYTPQLLVSIRHPVPEPRECSFLCRNFLIERREASQEVLELLPVLSLLGGLVQQVLLAV